MTPKTKRCCHVLASFMLVLIDCALTSPVWAAPPTLQRAAASRQANRRSDIAFKPDELLLGLVREHCLDCHDKDNSDDRMDLETLVSLDMVQHTRQWEQVIGKLRSRQMPPSVDQRPTEQTLRGALSSLTHALDSIAVLRPKPGRSGTFRRLNRTEYQNSIRDLLALDVDVAKLLPADESSHGFDNVTVGDLPPVLLARYISAARKISRLAIGSAGSSPEGLTVRMRPDVTQEKHVQGLPLGTRGGMLLNHTFPRDGEYEVHVLLMRDRNEKIEGLNSVHEIEFLLDRRRFAKFRVIPPKNKRAYYFDDRQLMTRVQVTAGPHDVGVTFIKNSASLLETKRQPLNTHFNFHRHPRLTPAAFQISITGPFKSGQASQPRETPSRRRIFASYLKASGEGELAAREIIANLARRAYRRPVLDVDLAGPMTFFRESAAEHGFEAGIEMALSAILVSPQFLFRIERDAPGVATGAAYQINEMELASRLSFFLWSSIPDEQLLSLAERGKLRKPGVLRQQVKRMLADPRSSALVTNFASQWLYLRNLDSRTPDGRLFPDFDDNLRQALRRETELFVQSIIQEDENVLGLLRSNYTFLNERLAKHYRIPHVYGSRFRRVELTPESHRGGLLRHGSILTVTSYATRTSPVIRGNWILENILGAIVPPPPAEVPALDETVIAAGVSMRERLSRHRADPTCARCHDLMDPLGFALENYDAIGRWRSHDLGKPLDVSGRMADGSELAGVAGLEEAILNQPQSFVRALSEKLLTYASGRGVAYDDGPAIRRAVRESEAGDYRFSEVILSVVNSVPFQMRAAQ